MFNLKNWSETVEWFSFQSFEQLTILCFLCCKAIGIVLYVFHWV